jgi:hypothetical protein
MSENENVRMTRATRVYTFLLRLYPKRHQQAFGTQMLQTFKDHYRDTSVEGGSVGIGFWFGVIADEARGIARERTVALRVLLAVLAIAMVAVLPFRPIFLLVLLPLICLSFLPLLVRLSRRHWRIAAAVFLALGLLGFFGIRGAVQAAETNTWCTTAHTAASRPPVTLSTAADYFAQGDYD